MNPDLTPLKTYINAQRENGITDEVISQALISSGWQSDMVTQALAEQTTRDEVQPEMPAEPAPTVKVNPETTKPDVDSVTVAVSESPATQQPIVVKDLTSDKNRKQVKIIGIIMIALGALAVAVNVYPEVNVLLLAIAVAQILIGVGILQFNKIAYTLFNVVAILSILSGLILLLGIPLMIFALTINLNFFSIIMTLLYVVMSVGQLAFYIYGGIVFHKNEVRSLFGKK